MNSTPVSLRAQRASLAFFVTSLLLSACGDSKLEHPERTSEPLTPSTHISYMYDALGRLSAVSAPAAGTAIYSYDAMGNVLSIERRPSTTLGVIQFSPTQATAGAPVIIYGTGFSGTASANVVKFNGVAATVSASTATNLAVVVPAGATTGPISVTVGTNTATSSKNFVVGSGGAPIVSSFSPTVVSAQNTVSIVGSNFDAVPVNNRVTLGGAISAVTSSTATTLAVTVPPAAQTGKITVANSFGRTTSISELFIAPPGIVAQDIQYTGRVAVDGVPVTASITTANKNGLMVFAGTAGQRVSLGYSAVTVYSAQISVYAPDGTRIHGPLNLSTGGESTPLLSLPSTGSYTVFIDPMGTYVGNVTVTVSTELMGTIVAGGAGVPMTLSRVGQNARLPFTALAGQPASIAVSACTISSGQLSLVKSTGEVVAQSTLNTTGSVIDVQTLTAGEYAILVDPLLTYTGSFTVRLYNQADVTGTITPNGAAVVATLAIPGQRARYTFSGTAGQWINLGVSAVSTGLTSAAYSILKPDGTVLQSATLSTSGGSVDPTVALPTTGTYTVLVNPVGAAVGSATLTLSLALAGTLTVDGAATSISLTRIGRTARYTFAGTRGQWIGIGATSVAVASGIITLVAPNGNSLVSMTVTNTINNGMEPNGPLPATGTYTVVFDPNGISTGSVALRVLNDLQGTVAINGTAITATVANVGQNARYSFTASAGQWLSLAATNVSTSLLATNLYVYKPDGTQLTGTSIGTAGNSLDFPTAITTAGTYTVRAAPAGGYTGSLKITLSQDVAGTLAVNAAATTVSIARPGQNARYTFPGTAGQQLTVRLTSNTLGATYVYLYRAGAYVTNGYVTGTSLNLPTVTSPTTDTHTITINPSGLNTGSIGVQVTSP